MQTSTLGHLLVLKQLITLKVISRVLDDHVKCVWCTRVSLQKTKPAGTQEKNAIAIRNALAGSRLCNNVI